MAAGAVEKAVAAELRALKATASSEGRMALALAARLDDPDTAATAVAMCAQRLLETLEVLRLRAAPAKASPLDEIRARRQARVARIPDAKAERRPRRGASS